MSTHTATEEQRTQTRLALASLLIPIFFVVGFATCIMGTYHKPHPNGIKVGVVGPAAATASLRAKLERVAGSDFDISDVVSVAGAVHAVRDRDLNAAFVPTVDPKRPATVIVAGGGGRLVATAAETLARAVTAAQGAQLVVRDVRPLSSGDEIGLGVFMFLIVCTICGYLAASLLHNVAPALSPTRRFAMIAGVSVLVPGIAYLIGGLGFGIYKGSLGTIAAFIGIGALYTFVIGLVTRLFQVLIGPPALFVSLAIFVFLNIPSLGATYTSTMLPSFWRFLNHFWLGAETTNAERSLLYFGGQDVGTDLLRLLAWTAVATGLLVLPVSRKLARDRVRPVAARPVRL
jgi:hypothetical protein